MLNIQSALSGAPFFDDWDSAKNFHRILYRPSRPVQVREMNQSQTILQEQIARMGRHIFNEGDIVIPGGVNCISDQKSITIQFAAGSSITDIQTRQEQMFVRSKLTGLVGKVMRVIPAEGNTPAALFYEIENNGNDGQTKNFSVNDACVVYYFDASNAEVAIANITISAVDRGVWVKVIAGTYFIRDHFVSTPGQDVVVARTGASSASGRVGFVVKEEIITEEQDASLYSNALGYPNYKAPGASRLRIMLVLKSIPLTAEVDDSFVEIARFQGGALQQKSDQTQYSLLGDTMAQRTYEESGDYVVSEFATEIKNHLRADVTDPTGVYTAAEGGKADSYAALIKPGIAYVRGYRIENKGLRIASAPRARDTQFINNGVLGVDFGSYMIVQNIFSLPDLDIKKRVQMQDASSAVVGTMLIRGMRADASGKYRLYVFDVRFNTGKGMSDVKKIQYSDANTVFRADLVSSVLFDSSKSSLIFRLPYDAVKTLRNGQASDTTYSVTRSFNATTNASGVVTVSLGSNEMFPSVDAVNYMLAINGASGAGTVLDPVASITLGGSPVGRNATINVGSGNGNKQLKLVAPVIKQAPQEKSKSLVQYTENLTFNGVNTKKLAKADVYKIISIQDMGDLSDQKTAFKLNNGQTANWYDVGSLETIDGNPITRNVTVVYQYFEHSPGDFFTVDSYGGMDRGDIPTIRVGTETINLSDVVDFRPVRDSAGDFTAATVTGEIARTGDMIRFDLFYYLPRVDTLFVDSDGKFEIKTGISAPNPEAPTIPSNAMRLFDFTLPAYTEDVTKIQVRMEDNRRYTMRDIGKLERRLGNVEYYTTLSMLENKTNSIQVIDPVTGNNRFKNGFAVDGFMNLDMSDLADPEWQASVDFEGGQLHARFVQNGADLTAMSRLNAKMVTEVNVLDYNEVLEIQQPYATRWINVNPYAVFTWAGTVSCLPASDFWRDIAYLPPVTINQTVNVTNDQTGGRRPGSVWSSTTTNWNSTTTTTYTVKSTTTSNTTSSSQDNLMKTEVINKMRSINIEFRLEGFRPFVEVYPFFDGVRVSQDCTPNGGVKGGKIITDASGFAKGVFTVPNTPERNFRTGRSVFRFTDNPTDDRSEVITSGETVFESGGVLDTRQVTITKTTTNTTTITNQQTGRRTTTVRRNDGGGRGDGGKDPIAQSFRCAQAGGMFLSSVEVWFRTKAKSLPVILQVREVVNGLPANDVLTFGEVVLTPDKVNISNDASVPTKFTFRDLVYLEEGLEYAIVLLADTQEYHAYIAQMGENVIGKPISIAKQPHTGVFFTSSNGSTWTPNQVQDMMFKIYRAEFDPTKEGVVTFGNTVAEYLPMAYNPLVTTQGSSIVRCRYPSHGFKVGDRVTMRGFAGGNGLVPDDVNGRPLAIVGGGANDPTMDEFSVDVGRAATATGPIGQDNVDAIVNMPFTRFHHTVSELALPGTEIKWEISFPQQSNRARTEWYAFEPGRTIGVPFEGVGINMNDIQVRAKMSTRVKNLTPQIDSISHGLVLNGDRVNTDAAKPAYAYVSRQIRFDNPNTLAKFYVGALLPDSSSMKFYVKPMVSADEDLKAKAWTELTPTKPIVNDDGKFMEYEYNLTGLTFIGYKVKIVLLSNSATAAPVINDVRTIALA